MNNSRIVFRIDRDTHLKFAQQIKKEGKQIKTFLTEKINDYLSSKEEQDQMFGEECDSCQ